MADWSGDTFGAIDDDAVDADSPLDAGVEHALAANETHRMQYRGIKATWSPLGGRDLLSVQWTSFLRVPLTVYPSHDAIDVGIGGIFPEGSGNPVEFRVQITDGRITYADTDLSKDPSGSADLETAHLQTSFSQRAQQPTPAVLLVQVRANEISGSSAITEDADIIGESRIYWENQAGGFTGPGSVYGIETSSGRWDDGDVIQDPESVSESGDPNDAIFAVVREQRSPTGQESEHDPSAFRVRAVTYSGIEIYSVDVELTSSKDVVPLETSSQNPNAKGPLGAQIVYDASSSSYLHAKTTQRMVERPRALSIGYTGDDRSDSDNWPSGSPELWAYARGDQTPETMVNGQSLGMSERDDWEIEVKALLAAFDLGETRQSTGDDESHINALIGGATSDGWDLTVQVDQFTTGDTSPTSINDKTFNFTFDHYAADNTGRTALPTQVYYLFNGHTQANSYPTDLAYIHHEGQMWDSDLGLMNLVEMRLPNQARTQDRPMVLNLKADHTGSSVSSSDAVLVLVGLSVWEVPP